jgi:hypothetical protein
MKYLELARGLTCGLQSLLMWPASYICSILDSYFDVEKQAKNKKKIIFVSKITLKSDYFSSFRIDFSVKLNVQALGYLNCL